MKVLLNTLFMSLICCFTTAQTAHLPLPAYTSFMAYSMQRADALSAFANPASMVHAGTLSAGVCSERLWMLPQLGVYRAAMSFRFQKGGALGVSMDYFGSGLYQQSGVGLAYARRMDRIDAGIAFRMSRSKAMSYDAHMVLAAEGGIIYHFSNALHAGVHVQQPAAVGSGTNAPPSTLYTAGIGFDASSNFFLGMHVYKSGRAPVYMVSGFEYCLAKILYIRAGITAPTATYFFGMGYTRRSLRLDVTASMHPYLGFSPGVMLLYRKATP